MSVIEPKLIQISMCTYRLNWKKAFLGWREYYECRIYTSWQGRNIVFLKPEYQKTNQPWTGGANHYSRPHHLLVTVVTSLGQKWAKINDLDRPGATRIHNACIRWQCSTYSEWRCYLQCISWESCGVNVDLVVWYRPVNGQYSYSITVRKWKNGLHEVEWNVHQLMTWCHTGVFLQ